MHYAPHFQRKILFLELLDSGCKFKTSNSKLNIVQERCISCIVDITEGYWITVVQAQNKRITQIRKILEAKEKNRDIKVYFETYLFKDGKVYRKLENGKVAWLVPKASVQTMP